MEENNKRSLSHLSILGYNKQKYTESEILEGVKNNQEIMFRFIYRNYFPGIRLMILKFGSLALDAEDVFQDGLVAASCNVVNGKFKGESLFSTYLTGICRNICRKQLEKAAKRGFSASIPEIPAETEFDSDELIRRLTYLKERMDEKCREIIDLRFGLTIDQSGLNAPEEKGSTMRFEEIASKLNIEADNARQRFKRCLEKLKETVFGDGVWNDLLATV